MDLTWSLDYCLACDRQTSGGAYCSQSCRLADLETSSTWSGTVSPTTNIAATSSSSSSSSTDTQRGSGFYLSPAINFANYKNISSPSPAMSTTATAATTQPNTTPSNYFSTNFTNPPSTKGLTPSSSISSLSSNSSSDSSQHQLSEHIHSELRAYTNSFDTTRNWRRRTWS